jgi:glycosyltransferase involved in cell wall biosynthesis
MNSLPRRVLFVAYLFPPAGGVGSQRVTKFVKYLPEFGWNASVLTVSNPSVPLHDESLLRDVPAGTILRRARTFEPGYALKNAVSASHGTKRRGNPILRRVKSSLRAAGNLLLQPDAQVLWHPCAFRSGLKLLEEVRHDAIIATGPPFSSLLLGARLSRKTGLPLVLDYRDEWDISNAYWENKKQGTLANWIQTRQQADAVRAADLLLATTPSSARAIGEFAQRAGSRAEATFIYNGFDPDDLTAPDAAPAPTSEREHRFRLAFIGTLWNLNSIEPVVAALERLSARSPQLAGNLELVLAGRRTDDQEAIVDRLSATPATVTKLPFVPHSEAVKLMQSADALLLLNADLPKTERIINAKTFEYMAVRRPMFVVAPEGDLWDVVRDLPGTVLCRPRDVDAIAEKLEILLEQHRCGIRHDEADWEIDRFHRRTLAGELAVRLQRITDQQAEDSSGLNSPSMLTPI